MKNTLPNISFLQTFGIILVVLGHSFYRMPPDLLFIRWIYGFHMPLFFFISGYLLHYVHPSLQTLRLTGKKGYLSRKARRLMLPYVAISSLMFVPKALMSTYAVRPITLTPEAYVDMLIYPYHNVLGAYWFLPTLFLIFVVFMLIARIGQTVMPQVDERLFLLLCIAINIGVAFHHESLFNLLGVAHYMVYFVLGYAVSKRGYDQVIARHAPTAVFLASLFLSVALLWLPDTRFAAFSTALCGIAMSMALAVLYNRLGFSFLNHLYGYTFAIYLYHGFFQILSLQVLLHYIALPPKVYIPLGFLTGIYGPRTMKIVWKNMRRAQ